MLCKKTFFLSKENHRKVDQHPFVKSLDTTNELYIQLIKQVLCVLQTQKVKLNQWGLGFLCKIQKDIQIPDAELFVKISQDTKDDLLFKSQIYMWYLSLMAGGKMIKKFTAKEHHYLFDYTAEDKQNLKNFIDTSVNENDHLAFIDNVNMVYLLIEQHFNFINSKQYS